MRKSEPPLPEHTADDDAEPIPRQLIDAWQRGESRLFQSVLWDPESYRRSVELVGIVLEHLRGAGPGSGPLIAAAALGPSLVEQALGASAAGQVAAAASGTAGLDRAGIAETALGMRQREVADEQARSRALRQIAEARGRGAAWAVLDESGDPSGNPLLPYRRLEVEVATGRALLVSATADDTFSGCIHRVDRLHLDLEDGRLDEPTDGSDADATYPTAEAREEAARRLRDTAPPL